MSLGQGGFLPGVTEAVRRAIADLKKKLAVESARIDEIVSSESTVDHGALLGRGDDDHSQYALADGSRGNFEVAGAAASAETAANSYTDSLISTEQTARSNADAALQGQIDSNDTDIAANAAALVTHEGAADPHGQYVLATGDTMTGNLVLSGGYVSITANGSDSYPFRLYQGPTAGAVHMRSDGDGYIGWIGSRADGTRRFAFESTPTHVDGSNFLLAFYDSAGTNTKNVFDARYVDSSSKAQITFNSDVYVQTPTTSSNPTTKSYVDSADDSHQAAAEATAAAALTAHHASSSTDHDDRYYTETESDGRFVNVTGDTMTGDLYVQNGSDIRIPSSANWSEQNNDIQALVNLQFPRWHDLFRFGRYSPSAERWDGSTWSAHTPIDKLFDGKSTTQIELCNSTYSAWRCTWTGVAYNYIQQAMIAFSYTGGAYPNPTRDVKWERSADGVNWTTLAEVTGINHSTYPTLFGLGGGLASPDDYMRLTITRTEVDGLIWVSSIKGLTARLGNQGLGSEVEFPYAWDEFKNVTFEGDVSGITPTAAEHLTRKDYVDAEVAAVQTAIDDHLADTVDAHDASAISYDGSGNSVLVQAWLTATDVNTAVGQLAGQLYTPDEETTQALIDALNALVGGDPISNPDIFANDLIVARHIASGSVTTAKLDAQAVTTATLAAGAVTADKLSVVTEGANIVTAGSFGGSKDDGVDWAAWVGGTSATWTIADSADADKGGAILQLATGVTEGAVSRQFPIEAGKTYQVRMRVRWAAGTGSMYAGMHTSVNKSSRGFIGSGERTQPDAGWGLHYCVINGTSKGTASAGDTGDWEIVEGTITIPDDTSGSHVWGSIVILNYGSDSSMDVDWVEATPLIETVHIENGAVTADKVAANTITAAQIAANTITASEIAAGTITSAEIAANTIVAGDIAAGTITATEVDVASLSTAILVADSVTATQIAAGSVTTDELAANAVTAAKIAANTITAAEIAAGTITGSEIAATTITAGNVAAGAITTDKLDADAVTAEKIAAGEVKAEQIAAGAITADKLRTDAMVSKNYTPATTRTIGTFTFYANGGAPYVVAAGGAFVAGDVGSRIEATFEPVSGDFFTMTLEVTAVTSATQVDVDVIGLPLPTDYTTTGDERITDLGFTTSGSKFDLAAGDIFTPGLWADGLTGDVAILGEVTATSFEVKDPSTGDVVADFDFTRPALPDSIVESAAMRMAPFNGSGLPTSYMAWDNLGGVQIVGSSDDPSTEPFSRMRVQPGHADLFAAVSRQSGGSDYEEFARVLAQQDPGALVELAVVSEAETYTGYSSVQVEKNSVAMWAKKPSTNSTWYGSMSLDVNGAIFKLDDGTTYDTQIWLQNSNGNIDMQTKDLAGTVTLWGDVSVNHGANVNWLFSDYSPAAATYAGLRTSGHADATEYVLLSDGNSTYVSAGAGSSVYIRAGSNDGSNEITVSPSGVTIDGGVDFSGHALSNVNEIVADLGSAADPSYTFDGNETNGMYGGSTYVALTSNGTVGFIVYDSSVEIRRNPLNFTSTTDFRGANVNRFRVYASENACLFWQMPTDTADNGTNYFTEHCAFRIYPRAASASVDSSVAAFSLQTLYGTDRHAVGQVASTIGDKFRAVNAENTSLIPMNASAFQTSSSRRYKLNVRTARKEGGLLDYAIPGDRALAFEQVRKVRPVLFDDAVDERLTEWISCPDHATEEECGRCPEALRTRTKLHKCSEWDFCSGTDEHPCQAIEEHVDRPGLIAEELINVYPKAVFKNIATGEPEGIDYGIVTLELLNVVQHLTDKVEELEEALNQRGADLARV